MMKTLSMKEKIKNMKENIKNMKEREIMKKKVSMLLLKNLLHQFYLQILMKKLLLYQSCRNTTINSDISTISINTFIERNPESILIDQI